ncbi:helix-turn-helix domain-containing protein [Methylobacterium terricola]|uniref:Helix-turn-helix domain-containing protein n=2 Tax=Methylobacterium terricola TaxID=2583531 RepID=A0A5C4LP77_9HYPH|nr:helix-turn-helix domain-containing protein [Methylobacterium terricola]
MLRKWVVGQIEARGIQQKELAAAIGVSADTMSRMLSGKRTIKAEDLSRISAFFGEQPPLTTAPSERKVSYVKVLGEVAAGAFVDMHYVDFAEYTIPYLADPRWSPEAVRALVVRGESINRQARDGDHVIMLDIGEAPRSFRAGDWVVAERVKGGLKETTVKQVRKGSDGSWELWPDSDDQRFQDPLIVEDGEADSVKVIGFVLDFMRSGTRF